MTRNHIDTPDFDNHNIEFIDLFIIVNLTFCKRQSVFLATTASVETRAVIRHDDESRSSSSSAVGYLACDDHGFLRSVIVTSEVPYRWRL